MPDTWKRYAAKTYQLELQFRPKLIRIIKAFRNDFIQDLQTQGQSTALNNLQQRLAPNDLTLAIQQVYKTAGLMGAKFTANEIKTFVKETEKKAAGFGRNEQWIRDVIAYLKLHAIGFVQDITSTMRDDILNILQKGIDENLTIPEIVANLRRANVIEARAKVIARTEINRAANVGHSVAAKSFPYEVSKKWSAAKDHRTRDSHVKVNGNQVDENDYFNVPIYKGKVQISTEQMLYPGDANASAANTVNCRCRVTHIPKRDSAGNLIMREQNIAPVIPMRRVPTYDPAQIAAILKANITVGVEK